MVFGSLINQWLPILYRHRASPDRTDRVYAGRRHECSDDRKYNQDHCKINPLGTERGEQHRAELPAAQSLDVRRVCGGTPQNLRENDIFRVDGKHYRVFGPSRIARLAANTRARNQHAGLVCSAKPWLAQSNRAAWRRLLAV